MQFVGHLLDGVTAAAQHRLGIENDVILDPLRRVAPRLFIDDVGHILEREG